MFRSGRWPPTGIAITRACLLGPAMSCNVLSSLCARFYAFVSIWMCLYAFECYFKAFVHLFCIDTGGEELEFFHWETQSGSHISPQRGLFFNPTKLDPIIIIEAGDDRPCCFSFHHECWANVSCWSGSRVVLVIVWWQNWQKHTVGAHERLILHQETCLEDAFANARCCATKNVFLVGAL